jgi:hypothetical protein
MGIMKFLGFPQITFLCMLEVIYSFDPFLKENLEKYGNRGKGMPLYSLCIVCDELIISVTEDILECVLTEVADFRYALIADSTPDISRVDELRCAQISVPGRHGNYIFVVAPYISGSSLWKLLYVMLLVPRSLWWLLQFWKLCALID